MPVNTLLLGRCDSPCRQLPTLVYNVGRCGKKISKDIWWYYGICLSYIAIYQLFALSTSLISGDVKYVGSRFARSEPET